jgi:hypothetical protein
MVRLLPAEPREGPGRRPSPTWLVNPILLGQFFHNPQNGPQQGGSGDSEENGLGKSPAGVLVEDERASDLAGELSERLAFAGWDILAGIAGYPTTEAGWTAWLLDALSDGDIDRIEAALRALDTPGGEER